MNKRLGLCFLILVFLVMGRGVGNACQYDLIGSTMDWRPQDYHDSQGITGVQYDETQGCLTLTCDLKGGDDEMGSGEILLDLLYVPCLEANVPVDMSNRTIEVDVQIPAGFVGSPSKPNGCQVFVKDVNYGSQYSTWTNCTSTGKVTIIMQPSSTSGLDATKIRILGVKFGISSTSTHQYSGTIKITNIEVTPSLPFYSPPALPAGLPVPFLEGDSVVDLKSNGFYVGNNKWFTVGGNWRLIEYRQNFGATAWFPKGNGVSLHPGFIGTKLELFRQAGITSIRVGLLDDGAAVLDKDGNVVGYDQTFRNDVSTLLSLAEQYDVKVEFALVDFMIAGKEEELSEVWLRGRREVIEDTQTRTAFITNFLDPFLREFGDEPALFGFDVINEPEWIIAKTDGGGWEDVTDPNKAETAVSVVEFGNFVTQCIAKIRELAPGKFVTVGVSCDYTGLVENFDLDYTAAHYYPNMGGLEENLAKASGDIPWSLEEYRAAGDIYDYLETVFDSGGAGALFWNLSPEVDEHCYAFEDEEEKLKEVRRFLDYLATLVPGISLNRTALYYGADTSGAVTAPQTFSIGNSGTGMLSWDVSDDAAWLSCSPTAGNGNGVVTVSVDPSGLAAGSYTGTVTVSDPGAANTPQTITVYLNVYNPGATAKPFGQFATPLTGSTVSSSVPVTGWVLDDLGVESVKIYRTDGANLAYIGDAVFVEGARSDIAAAFPGYPFNYQAGWGYMMLSHFLPNGGNGSFTLHAVAVDVEGHLVTLGTTTITCDNANAVKPFGAIDTPAQGGAASGSNFRNHGWVLTPMPNKVPEDSSTIDVYIDSVKVGNPVYNIYRSDIAELFPGYANSDGAHAYFDFDTTAYSNGVHTIFWTAVDDAGNADGIGSRYFTIQNSTQRSLSTGHWSLGKNELSRLPLDESTPVKIKRGYDSNIEPMESYPDDNGITTIEIKELERIEIRLVQEAAVWGPRLAPLCPRGYQMVGHQLCPLPIGSTLDRERGIFYWRPGVGFLGDFEFVFLIETEPGEIKKKIIKIRILHKQWK